MTLEESKKKLEPFVSKLVRNLNGKDIDMRLENGDLKNVVFSKKGVEYRMAQSCLYRYSGCMARIMKDTGKKDKEGKPVLDWLPLTDDEFVNKFIKGLIFHALKDQA